MSKKKLIIGIIVLIMSLVILVISFYYYSLNKTTKNNKEETFIVEAGANTEDILTDLQEKGFINSIPVALIYIKLNDIVLKAGSYELKYNMSMKEILRTLEIAGVQSTKITFIEGRRLIHHLKTISEEFNLDLEDIKTTLADVTYLKSLIDRYWFLSEEILNKEIYYPLEGYLFPDTYEFKNDITIKEIVEKMLDNTEVKLKIYKETIEELPYTPHEILTMASIIELEGNSKEDRKNIAGVIFNRLAANMNLGMDVTTYYAVNKEMGESLLKNELDTYNPYNTRSVTDMFGKLPVGPICNPSLMSIDAVLNPLENNYLYFYAELSLGKVHFATTSSEFQELIRKYS